MILDNFPKFWNLCYHEHSKDSVYKKLLLEMLDKFAVFINYIRNVLRIFFLKNVVIWKILDNFQKFWKLYY